MKLGCNGHECPPDGGLLAGERDPYFEQRPIVSQSPPHWSVLWGDLHTPDITRAGQAPVFDLARDPREHSPLSGEEAIRGRQALSGSLRGLARRVLPVADSLISDEATLDQLRALGYIR